LSTSGTSLYNPSIGSLALNAFSRCQIKRTELTAEHMENARNETNLMQADWVADGVTIWTVELVSLPLVQGTATYSIPSNVVMILDLYINNGSSNRLIFPFSRSDYASLANPAQQGFPSSFWQDRTIAQTFTLWPVPDAAATYTASYYAYTQIQDAVMAQGGNAAVPYWWLDAWTAGLAHRLSRHHAPALEAVRKADAIEAYGRAAKQFENVPLVISCGLSGYFRP
jgi:hypothetical protein